MQFDLIIMNPPFQATTVEGKRADKGKNLWSKFVYKGWLLSKAYLAWISPNSWLSSSANIGKGKTGINFRKDLFSTGHIIQANINECAKHFKGVASSFTYCIVGKEKKDIVPKIITNTGCYNIDLANLKWVPTCINPILISITNKVLTYPVKWIVKDVNRADSVWNKQPGNNKIFHTSSKKGILYVAEDNAEERSRKKVIISSSSVYAPCFDFAGELWYSNICMCIYPDAKDNLDSVKSQLSSKLIQLVVDNQLWGGWVSYKTISNLGKLECNKVYTDAEIYAAYNLTKQEIAYVESFKYELGKHVKKIG